MEPNGKVELEEGAVFAKENEALCENELDSLPQDDILEKEKLQKEKEHSVRVVYLTMMFTMICE